MGMINVNDLKIGMVLAEDLLDARGRLLLPRGSILNERSLRQVRSIGVTHASIVEEGEANISDSDIDERILKRSADLVAVFFRLADPRHEATVEIERLTVLRIARSLAAGAVMHLLQPDTPEEWAPLVDDENTEGENADLVGILRSEIELATLPDIYFRLMEVTEDPRSSAADLADVVGKDTSLSAKLLKLVNSPFYGFMAKVDTIQRAISLVGTNELTTLALGISVVEQFKDIPAELIDMKAFWKHNVACGVFAKLLADQKKMRSTERYFVAGLLHDIGRLIMFKKLPHTMTRSIILAQNRPLAMFEAEKETMGFDHAAAGALILKEWKIPEVLVNMVRYHHRPDKSADIADAALIHLADIMAVAFGIGAFSLEYVPEVNPFAWEAINLSVAIFADIQEQAERQIETILTVLLKM